MGKPKYERILLKLSGEAFKGSAEFGVDESFLDYMATQIKEIHDLGTQIAITVGGGNIIRGSEVGGSKLGRETADYAGMLATIINGLYFQTALDKVGLEYRLQSAINVPVVAEPLIPNQAKAYLEQNKIVLFLGGTGNPYMSTDTAAALRALQIGADLVVMSKYGVDGVYSKDPNKHADSKKFERIRYNEFLNLQLKVMDSTAASLCMDNSLPTLVYNILDAGSLARAVQGEKVGTLIVND